MDLNQALVTNGTLLLFVFARIVAMFAVVPVLSSTAIPGLAKGSLALCIAVVALPSVVASGYFMPENGVQFLLYLLGEIAIGLTIGFIVNLYFSVFQTAGELFSTQLGFGMSNVFDPMSEVEIPLLGQFYNLAALYLFLATNGLNKIFFSGVYKSFAAISPSTLMMSREPFADMMIQSIGLLFAYSFRVAFPIIAVLFFASITMGLLAKAAPQMNLLMLGFPLNILIGFMMMVLAFPIVINFFSEMISESFYRVNEFLMTARGFE